MSTTISDHETISIALHKIPDCTVTKAYITIDLHQQNSIADQALFAMYGEMLLSGNSRHNRAEFLDAIAKIGGEIQIDVSAGLLTIEVASQSEVWSKLLTLTAQMLTQPKFPAAELKRVQRLTCNAIHDQKENSKLIAATQLRNSFYSPADRNASADLNVLQETVTSIKIQDIQKLHQRLYTKKWILSVAGDPNNCKRTAKIITNIAPKKITTSPNHTTLQKQNKRLHLHNIPSKDNIEFSIGCAVPLTVCDNELPALSYGIAVLAKYGGFAGRLMSTIREKEGLTYSIYGRLESVSSTEQGYLRIGTFFNPPQTLQGITSTFREITNLHENGITPNEHRSFKIILETSTILRGDSLVRQLDSLHAYHRQGFTTKQIKAFESSLLSVSLSEVNMAITKYLNPKNMVICGAGPITTVKKDLEKFIKAL